MRAQRQTAIDVIGFDPATSFGWAHLQVIGDVVERVDSGVWDFSIGKHVNRAARLIKCEMNIGRLLDQVVPKAVAYEAVARHRGVDAAHLYGAYQGIIVTACEKRGIACQGYYPGTLKKAATGSGKLTKGMKKDAVMDAMWERFGMKGEKRDDEADAMAAGLAMIGDMGWTNG